MRRIAAAEQPLDGRLLGRCSLLLRVDTDLAEEGPVGRRDRSFAKRYRLTTIKTAREQCQPFTDTKLRVDRDALSMQRRSLQLRELA